MASRLADMSALFISTYELGHQPQLAAELAAELGDGSLQVLDMSKVPFSQALDVLNHADQVILTAPMLTGALVARDLLASLEHDERERQLIVVGLYANVLKESLRTPPPAVWLDRASATDIATLLQPASAIGQPGTRSATSRRAYRVNRSALMPLESYRSVKINAVDHVTGYLETSIGCRHRCLHCPVAAVWNGRIAINDAESVIADGLAQIEAGASHLSFGDPDFLNAPKHSLKIIKTLAEKAPWVTFDITTKISEILRHRDLIPELAASHVNFIISAVESLNDDVLSHLDKGHVAGDVTLARDLLYANGIGMHPTFVPFTPWSTLHDLVDIVEFIIDSDAIEVVEPIQYSIELLTPTNSLLSINDRDFGPYDAEVMGYTVSYRDDRLPMLRDRLYRIASDAGDESFGTTFADIAAAVYEANGLPVPDSRYPSVVAPSPVVMSEPWFCCAAPAKSY
ncbi:radical SAM protein [Ferrimicrobium acidiphilum]|uniref:radical SAM protein n=2 Tax=Ferrimicrobium acidiphilum TaxID=121039 RepID=UPI0023F3537B|nr:radical SAM protein [Ferrimicrobium acidiphilum]